MGHFLFYDGELLRDDKPLITAGNRGLRYGDGLFETMKALHGRIHLEQYHFARLFNGLQVLQFTLPSWFTAQYLAGQVQALCLKNDHPVARVRLMIFRGDGGLYDPENHFPHCIVQTMPLEKAGFELNENGLLTGIYPTARKSIDGLASLKSNNYLPYIMAALHTKQQQWNEAILLNSAGRICDATIANVFIVKGENIYTPPLSEGCVAGVMRQWLIEKLQSSGYQVIESAIEIADIAEANELFLTNAIQGIKWVAQCDDSRYTHRLTNIIHANLLKNLL
jgi:branched-chain amino acid aminotransferase